MKQVSVLIPSWNGRAHLEPCLAALAARVDPGLLVEILVLDNGSSDGTVEWLRRTHPEVRVVESRLNLGFAAGMNHLARAAGGDLLALLNNDTRPHPEWLAELITALAEAPPETAAVSGLILDWEGERLDFADGIVTFDGHAFQRGYRTPIDRAELPADGADLPFLCGANALVRRADFEQVGGFDGDYFAYFEDVDLGWRLRLAGRRIAFARRAVIRHRSMATSELLGRYRRGVLFERNAFATAFKNLDEQTFHGLMPAILATVLARTTTLLADGNPGGASLRDDPFPTLGHAESVDLIDQAAPGETRAAGPRALAAPSRQRRGLAERIARFGWRETARRALARLASLSLARGGPVITDPRTLAQLQAVTGILGGLDRLAVKRRAVQALRRVPEQALLEQFPLWIVPTYPGDEAFFASDGFSALLPPGLPLERTLLDELMAP